MNISICEAKCELCDKQSGAVWILSVEYGDGTDELFICDDCFDKLLSMTVREHKKNA